jgi:hypothetical protein
MSVKESALLYRVCEQTAKGLKEVLTVQQLLNELFHNQMKTEVVVGFDGNFYELTQVLGSGLNKVILISDSKSKVKVDYVR